MQRAIRRKGRLVMRQAETRRRLAAQSASSPVLDDAIGAWLSTVTVWRWDLRDGRYGNHRNWSCNEDRPEKPPGTAPTAALDSAYVSDIEGAFGTISVGDHGHGTSWSGRTKTLLAGGTFVLAWLIWRTLRSL